MNDPSQKSDSRFLYDTESQIPVYRFISIDRLIDIFLNNRLTLAKAICWDDPYENYFAKCDFYYKNGRVNVLNLIDQLFAQCWTLKSESDALWRIYSPDKRGFRIKSTIGKLSKVRQANPPSYIIKVRYLTREKMKSYFASMNKGDRFLQPSELVQDFAIKQVEFQHEEEIRFVYMTDTNSIDKNKSFETVLVDPNHLIEEITFDPRMEEVNENIFERLIRKIGFEGEVNKSKLYTLEPVIISTY